MTPCRCAVCTADRWAHRLLGFVAGLLVAALILGSVHAASRSAVHPGVSVPSWADAGGRRTGAPLGTSRSNPRLSDPLDGSRLGAGVEDSNPASGAPQPTATVLVTPAPSAWHHDPEISFFGPGLYGRRTACGLALTTRLLGVAHRSLPCGTLVEFRWRGRTLTVPVVDRGPWVAGRTWDLTGGACVALRHCWTGPIEWRMP